MKNNLFIKSLSPVLIVGLIAVFIFTLIHVNNDYMKHKDRACYIIEKVQGIGAHRNVITDRLTFVLKDIETNRYFDITVSPTTYVTNDVGDTVTFNLREMDIKQSAWDNFLYFFVYAFMLSISIVSLPPGIVITIRNIKDTNKITLINLKKWLIKR